MSPSDSKRLILSLSCKDIGGIESRLLSRVVPAPVERRVFPNGGKPVACA